MATKHNAKYAAKPAMGETVEFGTGKKIAARPAVPAGACVERELDTYPFGPAVQCPWCLNWYAEGPAVFEGGIKAGTPTYKAWEAAARAGDRKKMEKLENAIPVADKITKADVEAYTAPAVSK